jgi:uncharacterized OB-fold protein
MRPWCTRCLYEPLELEPISGFGTVYASTDVHRPPAPSFAELVPYTFALVDLDEGVRVVTMITGCEPGASKVGMRVEAAVDLSDDHDDGAAPLIFFRPAAPQADTKRCLSSPMPSTVVTSSSATSR